MAIHANWIEISDVAQYPIYFLFHRLDSVIFLGDLFYWLIVLGQNHMNGS